MLRDIGRKKNALGREVGDPLGVTLHFLRRDLRGLTEADDQRRAPSALLFSTPDIVKHAPPGADGVGLARHGTIEEIGPPRRLDVRAWAQSSVRWWWSRR